MERSTLTHLVYLSIFCHVKVCHYLLCILQIFVWSSLKDLQHLAMIEHFLKYIALNFRSNESCAYVTNMYQQLQAIAKSIIIDLSLHSCGRIGQMEMGWCLNLNFTFCLRLTFKILQLVTNFLWKSY